MDAREIAVSIVCEVISEGLLRALVAVEPMVRVHVDYDDSWDECGVCGVISEGLLRALVAVEPMVRVNVDYDDSWDECGVCGGIDEHTPSCPWVAAKRWIDDNGGER